MQSLVTPRAQAAKAVEGGEDNDEGGAAEEQAHGPTDEQLKAAVENVLQGRCKACDYGRCVTV